MNSAPPRSLSEFYRFSYLFPDVYIEFPEYNTSLIPLSDFLFYSNFLNSVVTFCASFLGEIYIMINTESYLIIIWNRRILRTLDMVLHYKTEISEQQISKYVGRLYLYIYIIAYFNIMIHHPYLIISKQTLHETGIYPLVEQFKWYEHQAYGMG